MLHSEALAQATEVQKSESLKADDSASVTEALAILPREKNQWGSFRVHSDYRSGISRVSYELIAPRPVGEAIHFIPRKDVLKVIAATSQSRFKFAKAVRSVPATNQETETSYGGQAAGSISIVPPLHKAYVIPIEEKF